MEGGEADEQAAFAGVQQIVAGAIDVPVEAVAAGPGIAHAQGEPLEGKEADTGFEPAPAVAAPVPRAFEEQEREDRGADGHPRLVLGRAVDSPVLVARLE